MTDLPDLPTGVFKVVENTIGQHDDVLLLYTNGYHCYTNETDFTFGCLCPVNFIAGSGRADNMEHLRVVLDSVGEMQPCCRLN